ncbi:hypothetical protein GCM10023194_79470 [Planotetraspora phitsanulokensis]|uniref:Uncharacterized protein n=1 Tax=Planotetraspora phitsanulokensis TaxID=575192 RepID=A0A8J3UAD3_9ACTN|nr:hypothetical protein [Planotetraspora phitsanulokensis]GII41724.1 hypothetical protein Pph01_67270 [Planotetraspora phitsanulokensis]
MEQYIKQAGEAGVSATEILRKFNIRAADVEAAVAGLDTIEVSKVQGGRGRPSTRYTYVTATPVADTIEEMNEVTETTLVVEVREESKEVRETAPDVPSAVSVLRARLAVLEAPKVVEATPVAPVEPPRLLPESLP